MAKKELSLTTIFMLSLVATSVLVYFVMNAGAFPAEYLFAGLFATVWFILWPVLSYKRANERGANALLWGLIGFLLGPIGFILALAVIPNSTSNNSNVSKAVSIAANEAKFCYGCGGRMHVASNFCPSCGKEAQ